MYNNISEDDLGLIEELATELMNQVECEHDWIRGKGDYNIKCAYCIYYPSQDNRFTCSLCLKQACASCLNAANQKWRQEMEIESEDRILSSRVRNLENKINNLEAELEELKYKLAQNNSHSITRSRENLERNTELKDQMITIKGKKGDKIIQLKEAIASFGNKYIVKLPFKDILGIRVPVKIRKKSILLPPSLAYLQITPQTNIWFNLLPPTI
jgi:ElaB/YqjD/DUF883 family membrane-anchored ribosome-binding protein